MDLLINLPIFLLVFLKLINFYAKKIKHLPIVGSIRYDFSSEIKFEKH